MEKFFIAMLQTIFDCLEECVATMTIALGRRLYSVLIILTALLGITAILHIMEIPRFIMWQEAFVAWIIVGMIFGVNHSNKAAINKVKVALAGRRDHSGERR